MFTRQLPRKKKSCSHCVKAKRKCDLETPKCRRCAKQDLRCEYPYAERHIGSESSFVTATPNTSMDRKLAPSFDCSPPLDFAASTLDPFLSEGLGLTMPSLGCSDLDPLGMMLISEQPLLEVAHMRQSPTAFSISCLNSFSSSRLLYAIDLIKKAPETMVMKNQTPWSHPRLYDDAMPRCLSEAYAASALSMSRNNTNSEFVSRHIENRFEELLQAEIPATLSGVLSHAHAFILYLSLQVFSNDFRAHAQAHRALSQLEMYGYRLHSLLIKDGGLNLDMLPASLSLYPIASAAIAWRSYILHESARRTLLVIFFMTTLCNALRGELGYCHARGALYTYLLGSAHLWRASSAFDFAKSWNEKDRLIIDNLDFASMLNAANPDDIDDFGRMLLVALLGVDEVRGWFAIKGGAF
ncbi:uncharacterized protein PV09_04008 [Verruconis gallopava]|uniref:Zn(2)-C6 fungal-type domain-containing protein n=1 Tax=Verruconis gallopava TaxID=253628 RepID=A0A0D2B0B9_9PEZI|nr:uncharacterized protein PV09_04008 [Verruconis gallopava]KIW04824.1 hypothetical protein PV09_04008 [Verruconis gallopava]